MRQRWSRILLSIAAALVLALTLTGVGIEVASSRLESNITAVDISPMTGRDSVPVQVVDDQGNYQAVNILLMGSDSREGQTSKKYGDPDLYTNVYLLSANEGASRNAQLVAKATAEAAGK